MLDRHAGAAARRLFEPVATRLLAWGVSADAVTIAATLAVVGSTAWIARGELAVGAVAVAVFALGDVLDGTMARRSGRAVPWGAFLDSTMDRIADAALFAALVVWFHLRVDDLGFGLAVGALVGVALVPYARARAEGLGASAPDGIAARADRLAWTLAAVLAVGLGAPVWVLHAALAVLLLAVVATLVQRVLAVRHQLGRPLPSLPR